MLIKILLTIIAMLLIVHVIFFPPAPMLEQPIPTTPCINIGGNYADLRI